MSDQAARRAGVHRKWRLGVPPTASLHNCLSWRPGSTWVALQCDPATLLVLDIGKLHEKPTEVSRLNWSKGLDVTACAWSGDGEFLVTAHATSQGALFIYKVEAEKGVTQLFQYPLFFWPKEVCVTVACDGTMDLVIAVAGSPGVVLYRASLSKESGQWEARQVGRLCHLWPVCAVRFSPGGRKLAAAGLGGQLCIWDMSSADRNATLELQVQVPAERVTSLAFSADSRALAAACWGGAVFIYLHQDSALCGSLLADPAAAAQERKHGADAPTGENSESPEYAPGKEEGRDTPAAEVSSALKAAVSGNAAAYESRLAAIEHGVSGCGSWRVGVASLPGQPVKPDMTGPTLLEWLGEDKFLLTPPSRALTLVKVEGAGLMPVRWPAASEGCPPTAAKMAASQRAIQPDVSGMEPELSSQHVPAGLRVLPICRPDDHSLLSRGDNEEESSIHGGKNAGMDGENDVVKGLALIRVDGQRLVVWYDRSRTLHTICQADFSC